MRRVLCAVAVATVALGGLNPGAALGAQDPVDSYCSTTGDLCLAVTIRDQRVKFEISTFSFKGPYRVCVKDPGDKECHRFKLNRDGDLYSDRVDWGRRFDSAPGRYKVIWKKSGDRLGEALRFDVSGPDAASRVGSSGAPQ